MDYEFGKRLLWIRKTLELSLKNCCILMSVSESTHANRENGCRVVNYNDLDKYSATFNEMWQNKYIAKGVFPIYEDKEVRQITISWIMLGFDRVVDQYERSFQILSNSYKEREIRYRDILIGNKKCH